MEIFVTDSDEGSEVSEEDGDVSPPASSGSGSADSALEVWRCNFCGGPYLDIFSAQTCCDEAQTDRGESGLTTSPHAGEQTAWTVEAAKGVLDGDDGSAEGALAYLETVEITVPILQETKVGVSLSRFKERASTALATRAAELLWEWKAAYHVSKIG